MTFESTLTPLKVHFLLGNFLLISRTEPKDYDKITEKFLWDAQPVENLKFSKKIFGNFRKNHFFVHIGSRNYLFLYKFLKFMILESQRYQICLDKSTLRVCPQIS